jgi:hypothetical protein
MRGAFNLLMPPDTPMITTVTPSSAARGETVTIRVTGVHTNFANGWTYFWAGPGLTITNFEIVDACTFTAKVSVAASAAPGPRTLATMTVMEEAVLPNGFRVE